jgi:hypothetical protein
MDQEIPCSLKNIKDWDEAKAIFKEIPAGWAFRGQSKSSWTLKTSLERTEKGLLIADAEEFLYHEFKRRAHNYIRDTVLPKTTAEWLALMQHYATPRIICLRGWSIPEIMTRHSGWVRRAVLGLLVAPSGDFKTVDCCPRRAALQTRMLFL